LNPFNNMLENGQALCYSVRAYLPGIGKVRTVRCFRQLAEPPVVAGCTLDCGAGASACVLCGQAGRPHHKGRSLRRRCRAIDPHSERVRVEKSKSADQRARG
jgi:hypothetical protein